ncbi:glycosyltransferase [uncultured Megasphaera sp.]|uniref:glycosyltransferase n=1 Tax=uncultured Megasphaera sp. TaxID=165188 RepID=UPI0025E9B555|nr:glycosyltransferase [uncultured Megasphaera sp.]
MKTLLLLYMGDETVTASAGTEKVLTEMANAMTERGYNVIVATNDAPDAIPYFPFDAGVQCFFLDVNTKRIPFHVKVKREVNRVLSLWDKPVEAYRAALSCRKLQQHLQPGDVDCIIAYNHEAIQVASRWARGTVPLIAMMHNAIRTIMGNCNQAALREKEKADVIQVLMPSYVEEAKQYVTHTPVVWIPNTVMPVPPQEQACLSQKKEMYTIITVGRIDGLQKQTHILVQAFAKLADRYPQWQVCIWGEIKKRGYYDELCQYVRERGLETRIRFEGTTKAVRKKLQQADIFAFPSAFEGFGLALTEAMATGLPSVGFHSADAVNGLIVDGQNGILCDDGVDAFADGLERLMTDQALRVKLGHQAAADMKPYCPDAVWQQWQELIEAQIGRAKDPKECD